MLKNLISNNKMFFLASLYKDFYIYREKSPIHKKICTNIMQKYK